MDINIERIFSYAVALDQSGRMKNSIYCKGQVIFILNNEGTVLLRFETPLSHKFSGFKTPISFKADDYESGSLREENGLVIFTKIGEEFIRTKSCRVPNRNFNDVERLWKELQFPAHSHFSIHQKSLELINEGLSHLEFSSENRSLKIIQRDIFSGNIISMTRKPVQGLLKKVDNIEQGLLEKDKIEKDFGPIGIRTDDFIALYSFQESLSFGVTDKEGLLTIKGGSMEGILAWCIYDELGTVEVLRGRKE